jgi:hypothetical protein
MWLTVFGIVVPGIWAVGFGALLLTGGLRTKHGFIIGRQRTPQQLDEMVARTRAREARRKKRT